MTTALALASRSGIGPWLVFAVIFLVALTIVFGWFYRRGQYRRRH